MPVVVHGTGVEIKIRHEIGEIHDTLARSVPL